MTTAQATAHTDAELVLAGILELAELDQLLAAGRSVPVTTAEVAKDLLGHLDALRTWVADQVLEAVAA